MKNASIRVNVEKQIPNVGLRLFSIPVVPTIAGIKATALGGLLL